MEVRPATTPTSKSKCFSFWPVNRRARRKAASKVRISWPDLEQNELVQESPTKPEPREEVCFSKTAVSTFARCDTGTKPYPQRMTMRPFFGLYSGSLLTFDIRRSRSNEGLVNIRVTIQYEGMEPKKSLTTLYIPRHKRASSAANTESNSQSLKDRCLAFAHNLKAEADISEIASSCKQPMRLFFLCQKHILLNLGDREVNSDVLPKTETFEVLKLQSTQNIFVRVYLSNQAEDVMLRMRVKPTLALNELRWMICGRLPFSVHPSCLALYQFDSLDILPPDGILQPNQTLLHCTVSTSPPLPRPRIAVRQPCRYMISLIGKDVTTVNADPSTTLFNFQDLVKSKFGLSSTSYIYFPNLGRATRSGDCGIKMSTIIDKSTINLIDSMRRNLPIVDGVPLGMSKYEKLPAYTRTIGSLGISPSEPVIAFEVTGPTIPISFRAAVQDRGNCNYSLVSDRVHAVSVNPTWTIRTLLKYVECISKIPCVDITLNSEVLPDLCNVSTHLTCRCWLLRNRSTKQLELVKDLPTIVHS